MMRTAKGDDRGRNRWVVELLVVLALAAPAISRADPIPVLPAGSTLVFSQSGFISNEIPLQTQFDIPFAGTLTIQLIDLTWPEKFSSLSFIMTSGHEVLAKLDAPGTITYELDAPGRFFGFLSAGAEGAMSLAGEAMLPGTYLLQMSLQQLSEPQPVALPAALWLLVSGMLGIGMFRRRLPILQN